MAGDTRFVEFVDDAATQLGRLIDTAAGGEGDGQDPTRPGLDPARRR
jgi:hypothetical protein